MSINEFLLTNEPPIRFGVYCVAFAIMALWESASPRRRRLFPRLRRWPNNLSLMVLNNASVTLLFSLTALDLAVFAAQRGWGVFNALTLPSWMEIGLSVLILDLAIYLQHIMFHAMPVLWRVHRVHHADPDFDVTTGTRFHPVEIALSMLIKFALIAVIGPPVIAVTAFEILLNAMALFNHANVQIPDRLDRSLRWILVTPDMHRIHHSIETGESNTNFGFNVSWWDRLFGSYRSTARLPQVEMLIGVAGLNDETRTVNVGGLLALPFHQRYE